MEGNTKPLEEYDRLNIGDKSTDLKVEIVDKDRLCYLVKTESRGSYGIRTISKQLLQEFIEYFKAHPKNTANDAREELTGKTDLDKFEYGYSATLTKLAKMVIDPQVECICGEKIAASHIAAPYSLDYPLQQIYYGAPGTGKSYEIDQITKSYDTIRTTFHPDSDYSTFVGAYKPMMEEVDVQIVPVAVAEGIKFDTNKGTYKEKRITYKFVKQAFLKAYLGAWKKYAEGGVNGVAPQFLVIEEINRGNCAQIFGDLFQLLDRQDNGFSSYPIEADADLQREIAEAFAKEDEYKLPESGLALQGAVKDYVGDLAEDIKSGKILLLPSNFYIWATMNTSDQSLFPIDSAFKRRWDWTYIPISDAGKNWMIDVAGNRYGWWQFLERINEEIGSATNSEDKKLGYFFCKAQNGIVSAKTFVGKVVFYLWNDVFKDYEFGDAIFNDEDGNKLSFSKFYTSEGKGTKIAEEEVESFLKKLGLKPVVKDSTNENDEDIEIENDDDDSNASSNGANRDRYSVNGNGSYGKCRAPFEAVKVYVSQNPQMSAKEIVEKWISLNVTHLPHLVETEQEFEQRALESNDKIFRKKAKRLDLPNGEVIYVSNQFKPNLINELISKLENSDLGVHIALIDE